jgi:hypothetical protein
MIDRGADQRCAGLSGVESSVGQPSLTLKVALGCTGSSGPIATRVSDIARGLHPCRAVLGLNAHPVRYFLAS